MRGSTETHGIAAIFAMKVVQDVGRPLKLVSCGIKYVIRWVSPACINVL